MSWMVVVYGKDATVQMGLAGCLPITCHSNDGGTGPITGKQVGRPAQEKTRRDYEGYKVNYTHTYTYSETLSLIL